MKNLSTFSFIMLLFQHTQGKIMRWWREGESYGALSNMTQLLFSVCHKALKLLFHFYVFNQFTYLSRNRQESIEVWPTFTNFQYVNWLNFLGNRKLIKLWYVLSHEYLNKLASLRSKPQTCSRSQSLQNNSLFCFLRLKFCGFLDEYK